MTDDSIAKLEEMVAEEEARIDIGEPLTEIANRLGLDYHRIAHIDFRPSKVIAEVYVPNEQGKPHIDLDTGQAVMETRTFRVRT